MLSLQSEDVEEDLRRRIINLDKENRELHGRVLEQKVELNFANARIIDATNDKAVLELEVVAWKEETAKARENVKILFRHLTQVQEKYSRTLEELCEANATVALLQQAQADHAAAQLEIGVLQQRVSELSLNLDTAQLLNKQWAEELLKKQAALDDIHEQLFTANSECQQLRRQLAEQTAAVAESNLLAARLSEQVQQGQHACVEKLQHSLEQLQQELDKAQAQAQLDYKEQLQNKDKEVERLTKQLEEALRNAAMAQNQAQLAPTKVQEEMEELRKELQELKREKVQQLERQKKLEEQLDKRIHDLTQQVSGIAASQEASQLPGHTLRPLSRIPETSTSQLKSESPQGRNGSQSKDTHEVTSSHVNNQPHHKANTRAKQAGKRGANKENQNPEEGSRPSKLQKVSPDKPASCREPSQAPSKLQPVQPTHSTNPKLAAAAAADLNKAQPNVDSHNSGANIISSNCNIDVENIAGNEDCQVQNAEPVAKQTRRSGLRQVPSKRGEQEQDGIIAIDQSPAKPATRKHGLHTTAADARTSPAKVVSGLDNRNNIIHDITTPMSPARKSGHHPASKRPNLPCKGKDAATTELIQAKPTRKSNPGRVSSKMAEKPSSQGIDIETGKEDPAGHQDNPSRSERNAKRARTFGAGVAANATSKSERPPKECGLMRRPTNGESGCPAGFEPECSPTDSGPSNPQGEGTWPPVNAEQARPPAPPTSAPNPPSPVNGAEHAEHADLTNDDVAEKPAVVVARGRTGSDTAIASVMADKVPLEATHTVTDSEIAAAGNGVRAKVAASAATTTNAVDAVDPDVTAAMANGQKNADESLNASCQGVRADVAGSDASVGDHVAVANEGVGDARHRTGVDKAGGAAERWQGEEGEKKPGQGKGRKGSSQHGGQAQEMDTWDEQAKKGRNQAEEGKRNDITSGEASIIDRAGKQGTVNTHDSEGGKGVQRQGGEGESDEGQEQTVGGDAGQAAGWVGPSGEPITGPRAVDRRGAAAGGSKSTFKSAFGEGHALDVKTARAMQMANEHANEAGKARVTNILRAMYMPPQAGKKQRTAGVHAKLGLGSGFVLPSFRKGL